MQVAAIIKAIEEFAPRQFQQPWDNSGLQVGSLHNECTGMLFCVDVTPIIVQEAIECGCNLIVSHHPLIFKGVKQLTEDTPVGQSLIMAVKSGIAVYSCHTPVDSVPLGVSYRMAQMLGAGIEEVLSPCAAPSTGLGVVANFEGRGLTPIELIERVKAAFSSPVVRCTPFCGSRHIHRVAMCGGSGSEFIPLALEKGAQAYITSDTRYHDFVDYQNRILIVDIGHFESESCTKQIFYEVIKEKFPNFACYLSHYEKNPINYL